jgi:hypothetical protein
MALSAGLGVALILSGSTAHNGENWILQPKGQIRRRRDALGTKRGPLMNDRGGAGVFHGRMGLSGPNPSAGGRARGSVARLTLGDR